MKLRFLFILVSCFTFISLINATQITEPTQPKGSISTVTKKLWDHKGKIAAGAVLFITFCFYRAQQKWNGLYTVFQNQENLAFFDSNKKKAAADNLARFTHDSWFILPKNKECVVKLIQTNQEFFPNWQVWATTSKIGSTYFSFKQK